MKLESTNMDVVLTVMVLGGLLRGLFMVFPVVSSSSGYVSMVLLLFNMTSITILLNVFFAVVLAMVLVSINNKQAKFTILHAMFVGFVASAIWNLYVGYSQHLSVSILQVWYRALFPGAFEGIAINAMAWYLAHKMKVSF